MLEVRNLSVRAGKTLLIEDVSFTLNEGRICALLGANGSGKTSLIRALTSYYPHYQGSIMFSGQELRNSSKREKARESIGHGPAEFNFLKPQIQKESICL